MRERFWNLSPRFDKNPAPNGTSCANIRPIEVSMARLEDRRRSSRPEAAVRCACSVLPWDPTKTFLRKIVPNPGNVRLSPLLVLFLAVSSLCIPGIAQTDVNDVHVHTREMEKPK